MSIKKEKHRFIIKDSNRSCIKEWYSDSSKDIQKDGINMLLQFEIVNLAYVTEEKVLWIIKKNNEIYKYYIYREIEE